MDNWCVEITRENYQELNAWLHANKSNYPDYRPFWVIDDQSLGYKFHCKQIGAGHSLPLPSNGYKLISTEQFRILSKSKWDIEVYPSVTKRTKVYVQPRKDWIKTRLLELSLAMENLLINNHCIPTEWVEEYNLHIETLKNEK